MKPAKYTHRYHCFNAEGKKVVASATIPNWPEPLEGHTAWVKGLGPLSEEQRRVVGKKISDRVKGVPKTQEQKHKMRLAKLGVPKSEEHKRNMSLSQLARAAKLREERQNASA